MKDRSDLKDDIINFTKERLLGSPNENKSYSFESVFCSNAFSRICINILENYRINPESMLLCARFYLSFLNEETAAAIFIDRQQKIKEIRRFARGYKAKISEFTEEIAHMCETYHTKRFVVIFNYDYKGTPFDELYDIDKFYNHMSKNGFKIIDCIKVTNGKASSLILPYNNNGYKK